MLYPMLKRPVNQKEFCCLLRDFHCQKIDQGGPMVQDSLLRSVMLAYRGTIQAEIGVGMPQMQHGRGSKGSL